MNKTVKNKRGQSVIIIAALLLIAFLATVLLALNPTSKAWASASLIPEETIKTSRYVPTLEDDFKDDRVIVTLKQKYSKINRDVRIDDLGVNMERVRVTNATDLFRVYNQERARQVKDEDFYQIFSIELKTKGKEKVLEAIAELEKSDMVLAAEPDYNYTIVSSWTPNDPFYEGVNVGGVTYNQWGLTGSNGIQSSSAWDITTGNANVRVGIMEAGFDANHEDLAGNVLTLPGGFTPTAGTNLDHGTHVAGIVGAVANNNIGVAGVAQISLVAIDWSDFVTGLSFAQNNDIFIVNASFGYLTLFGNHAAANTYHAAAIYNYGLLGGLLICAAGNGIGGVAQNLDSNPLYPASYSTYTIPAASGQPAKPIINVISVGSIDENGERSSFSNYGENNVQIFAPGGDILSTYPEARWGTTVPGYDQVAQGYARASGTSMAAPHVTGTAALMASMYETRPHNMTCAEISAQIKSAILDNVTLNSNLTNYCVSGGHLNAYEALRNLSLTKEVFNDFGYNGSTYYWNGAVDMTVEKADRFYVNSSGTMVFTGSTCLDFLLSTVSSHNSISQINGTVSFQLKNSSGSLMSLCILGVNESLETLVSTVNVSTNNTVTLDNESFYAFTGWLSNDTYTLTLTSNLKRSFWTSTKTETFTFIVDKPPSGACVAEGTMVTLADGSQVAVENLTGDEELLVWNHHTGDFDVAPILFIDSDPIDEYEITHLYFSDGTDVKVIYEHGFWNTTLNQYVFIRDGESTQYIGDWFNKQTIDENGNTIWENVQLVDVQIYTEQTTAWSPVTFSHLNFYVNGMLSMPGATEGLINIFEVDANTMQYDMDAYLADIEEYGLFTYEEFAEIIPVPEIIFEAFNGQYLKISIGKGLIDMEGIVALIESYAEFFQIEDDELPDNQNPGNGQGNGNGNGKNKKG